MTTLRFSGKRALVTGAASGIGLATVRLLASEGASILAADRNKALLRESIADLPGATAVALDVTSEQHWSALRATQPIPVHIFVGCAGISHGAPLATTSLEDWRRVLSVNLDGQFLGLRYALDTMEAGGSVILVGSASGVKPAAGAAAYCTSKAALRMLVKVAALEAKPKNVRVNSVSPAGVVTPMWKAMAFFEELTAKHGEAGAWDALGGADPAKDPLERMALPEEIARVILWLASDESRNMTGADIAVDAGYTVS
ncbi:MAG: SDR family oxidoreductase [Bryobacteraceae bacterium]